MCPCKDPTEFGHSLKFRLCPRDLFLDLSYTWDCTSKFIQATELTAQGFPVVRSVAPETPELCLDVVLQDYLGYVLNVQTLGEFFGSPVLLCPYLLQILCYPLYPPGLRSRIYWIDFSYPRI